MRYELFNSRTLFSQRIALLISIIFVVTGFWIARGPWRLVWDLHRLIGQTAMEKQLSTYGSDWQIYDHLMNETPEDSRILLWPADEVYRYRLHFFAYPRRVEYISSYADFANVNWDNYDYFYVYLPLRNSNGVVNLTRIMAHNQDEWTLENLYEIEKTYFSEQAHETFDEFKQSIVSNLGIMFYQISE